MASHFPENAITPDLGMPFHLYRSELPVFSGMFRGEDVLCICEHPR